MEEYVLHAISSPLMAEFSSTLDIQSTERSSILPSDISGTDLVPVTFKNFGIGCHFVEGMKPEAFDAAIDDNTRAIFIEAVANPDYSLFDIPAIAKVRMVAKWNRVKIVHPGYSRLLMITRYL